MPPSLLLSLALVSLWSIEILGASARLTVRRVRVSASDESLLD